MTTLLRGSGVTNDPRLDRVAHWDPRNENYPIRKTLEAAGLKRPRSYTWSIDNLYDQGKEGRCVEYAICHELRAKPVVEEQALVDQILERRAIYYGAQRIDPWPGGSYPGADPVYEGTTVLHGMTVARNLGYYGEFRWAQNLDDFIMAVGHVGPGVIGINYYSQMFDPAADGTVVVGGSIEGGHALCVNKVNVKEEYFGLPQSWGRGFGDDGFIKIRFHDMERLLNEDGEFCIPVNRRRAHADSVPSS